MAGPEHDVFCGAGSDVFAFNNSVAKLRMGSDESLARIMGKVQMQNFLNETQNMEALMAPLVRPLQDMQHPQPGWVQQQDHAARAMEAEEMYMREGTKGEPEFLDGETMLPHAPPEQGPPPEAAAPIQYPGYPTVAHVRREGLLQRAKVLKKRARNIAKREAESWRREAAADDLSAVGQSSILGSDSDGESEELDEFALERLAVERAEREREETLKHARSRKHRKFRPVVSRIPWGLLDELESEKHKLKLEKAVALMFDANKLKPSGQPEEKDGAPAELEPEPSA